MSKRISIPLIGLISILTVSCSNPVYVTKDLTDQLPPPLQGEQLITNNEVKDLPDKTVKKIKLYEDRIITLTNIIKSTHSEK